MTYEEPRFTVVDSTEAYEIRACEPQLVAEVAIEGEYECTELRCDGGSRPTASFRLSTPLTQLDH